MTKWYAVQRDREDAWDNGSYNKAEAVWMLKEQGSGLIAVIDDDTKVCIEEIEYDEVKSLRGRKPVENGWHDVTEEVQVYVMDGMVLRAIVDGLPGSVYKWDSKNRCYTNACPVKYETFRKGFREDRYIVK